MRPKFAHIALQLAGGAALLAAGAAQAGGRPSPVTVSEPVVRASLGANPNTAAYLKISNSGGVPDRLVSVSCGCAAKVEAHASMGGGGMMQMKPTGPLTIPAHGSVVFAPGGYHLMVTGLRAPLIDGKVQPMTLRFERAGAVQAVFRVRARIEAPRR